MAQLKIVIGNKKYSSWSLRGWLAVKHTGEPFDEIVVPLDQPTTREHLLRHSPSGRVPVLIDGDTMVWDSLAICEYLSERFPQRRMWPEDRKARALARSISAEMHAGFQNLRNDLCMKIVESIPTSSFRPEVKEEIQRILSIWTDCRQRYGRNKPFLFGDFTIADPKAGSATLVAVRAAGRTDRFFRTFVERRRECLLRPIPLRLRRTATLEYVRNRVFDDGLHGL